MRKELIPLIIVFCFNSLSLYANEIAQENIRLIVNQTTGGFTLSLRAAPDARRFDMMFNDEMAASYASVNIDGNIQRLGNKNNRPVFEKQDDALTFVYNVDDIIITQVFTPVNTSSSLHVNGINISFKIQNTGSQSHSVGLRMLLDTHLGEGIGRTHFTTADQSISSEKIIIDAQTAKYWISKSSRTSLMGSIINPIDNTMKAPDYIIFGGWKRLYDTNWDYAYKEGRTFSGDSAVCYYFEPVIIERGKSITYTIFLTAEDTEWFSQQNIAGTQQNPQSAQQVSQDLQPQQTSLQNGQTPAQSLQVQPNLQNTHQVIEPVQNNTVQIIAPVSQYKEEEILNLMSLSDLLNRFIRGEVELNEQNLNEIENAVKKFRQ